jgi:hypothetical protein
LTYGLRFAGGVEHGDVHLALSSGERLDGEVGRSSDDWARWLDSRAVGAHSAIYNSPVKMCKISNSNSVNFLRIVYIVI